MGRFSFSSLRVRLLLLVLLAVIPALGLMLYTGLEQRRLAAVHAQEGALRVLDHGGALKLQALCNFPGLSPVHHGVIDVCFKGGLMRVVGKLLAFPVGMLD